MTNRDVTVTAAVDFTYGSQSYRRGHPVTLPAVDAALLHRQGKVSITRNSSITPDPDPEPQPTRSRRYRRRDLVAESTDTLAE